VRGSAVEFPERGEDVKVMALRSGGRTRILLACAFIGGALRDQGDYRAARARAADSARSIARDVLGEDPTVAANAADDDASGAVYLTVTGTSAEAGDDGQTGRGNRANGLITPGRPMTIESVAGKNPITHVGKLYNVAAIRVAESIVARLPEVREAQVLLVSRIGAPIEEPEVVDLRLRADSPKAVAELAPRAAAIAREELAGIGALWEHLLARNLAGD
jgi:S-adenosylmethionine synthetase